MSNLGGRPPVPTAIKELMGNPGKRPLNAAEPSLEPGVPPCPDYLDEVAIKEWNRIVPILLRMRVLTEADEYALGILCQTYSTMVDAQRKMKLSGLIQKGKNGYVQASPFLDIVLRCQKELSRGLTEFGLTPSSRVRLHAAPPPAPKKNKWADESTVGVQ